MALYIGNKKYCAVKKIGVNNQDILITQNGNYTPEEDYSGFGLVRVNVPEPVLTQLTVDPSTEKQTIDPLNDGFSQVIVNPVTAAIDADIIASNIKKDVNILGVTGTLEFTTEELIANPTIKEQVFTPTEDGYSKVTINPVTASIDSNIIAGNIKDGVEILGVEGTLIESNETTRNITANGYYTAPEPYTGFSSVDVDVEAILEPLTITPTTSKQVFSAEDAYHGFSPVTVNAVTAAIDSDIVANNIRRDVEILGVTGTLVEIQEITPTIELSHNISEITGTNGSYMTVTLPDASSPQDSTIQLTTQAEDGYSISDATLNLDLRPLTVSPSTQSQTINILDINDEQTEEGTIKYPLGFYSVTVNPVTAAIDSNITAANIKEGITILGVTGTCIELNATTITINPTTSQITRQPEGDYNGFSQVTVNAVTSSIDSNIQPENIKDGITILGVEGTCVELNGTTQTVTPTTSQQVLKPASPYNGFTQVTINAVTSAIDADIQPGNIKKDVSILGVTGTLEFTTEELTVNPSTSLQEFEPTEDGYSKVTVNAVTASIDPDIVATNIKQGVNILGVVGSVVEVNNQTLSVTDNGTFVPDEGYTGFSSVEVNVISAVNTNLHIVPSGQPQEFTPPEGYTGFDEVTVEAVSAAADANIKPENIVKGITILGVTGTAELVLQEKHVTINASTPTITTYTPDQDGCNGYSKFIFDLSWLEDQLQALNSGDSDTSLALQNKTVSTSGVVTADTGYDGLGQVTVDLSAYENQIADLEERVAELEAQLGI